MSYVQRLVVPVTTDGSGNATAYSDWATGLISQIRYVIGTFAAGVDFTITLENTGENVWTELNVNASATRAPRQATHGTDGSPTLYAAGAPAVQDKIAMANDRVKIVIAQGGTFYIMIV